MIAAYDMRRGKKLSEEDMTRLETAQQRIEEVIQYANV
jgi:exonuclease VII small subunit